MNLQSKEKIFEKNTQTIKIINFTRKTSNQLEVIPIKNTNKEIITSSNISNNSIKQNIYMNNQKYHFLIKKIAKKLKKRIKFPKCKIFKFYESYRILILRIAKGIKKTAKKLNFWEKWENSITEQDINQIQEIASTACKIIEEGIRKKSKDKKKISSSDRDNKKNIKIGLSLFKKSNEKEEKIKKQNININDEKSEIQKQIAFLKNLNPKEDKNVFIQNFTNFLENNDIIILTDTKLPNITNNKNKYLLSQKEFWIKYIIFISMNYKNEISIYNYVNFIEQFYIWNNNDIFDDFNKEIKNQINLIFNKNIIKNFLEINKLNNLDALFERYKNIHTNFKYKEVKVNENECQCPTCRNNGFIKKIINYNKKNNEISYSENNHLSYINITKKEKNIKSDINKGNKINKKKYENKKLSSNEYSNINNENLSSDKYYDIDVFEYLKKIEKRKMDEEEKEKGKKSRNSTNKKEIKAKSKSRNKSRKKSTKNYKIKEIFDLLSIDGDGDLESLNNNDYENSSTKANKRNKSNKKRIKYYS